MNRLLLATLLTFPAPFLFAKELGAFAYPAAPKSEQTDDYHSFKYAATMQAAQTGPAPVLIRIETRAGHGAGKPTSKIIEDVTDQLSFLVKALGMKIAF